MKRKTLTLKGDTTVKTNGNSVWTDVEMRKIAEYSQLFNELH